jgi:transposase
VECTGSYGAALTRHLRTEGVEVIEVNQPDKATRRRRGKTDALDAEAAARAVLSGRATAIAKASDGPVEMMRMFKLAKASAIKARTQTINQLKAVLVAADPVLREELSGLSNPVLVKHCVQLDINTPSDLTSAAAYTLRLLARRILELTNEIRDLEQRITDAVTTHTHAAGTTGHRPRQRRRPADHRRRQPRSPAQRGLVRGTVRRQPHRGILGQDSSPPPQPRRRPPSQRRPLTPALGPTHPRLPQPPHQRRQRATGGNPLPQTPARSTRSSRPHPKPSR